MLDFIAGLVSLVYFLTISVATKQHFRSDAYPLGMYLISVLSLAGIITFAIHAFWGQVGLLGLFFALTLFAQALFFWAMRHSRGENLKLALDNDMHAGRIIRTGPWRYMRHPFYASYVIFWLACALATQHVLSVVVFLTLFFIYVYSALREEGALASGPLREDYQAYKEKVGFFMPRLAIRN